MSDPLPLFERVGVLRPLQHRDFRLLWIGQTVSMIGDGVYVFAVAWFVYKDLERLAGDLLARGRRVDGPTGAVVDGDRRTCRTGWTAGT